VTVLRKEGRGQWGNGKGYSHTKFQGYLPKNIHNAGEIRLFFRFLPNETLSLKGDPSNDGKNWRNDNDLWSSNAKISS
jgi:hypothetical protein